jgi:hypothetical protein
MRIRRVLVQPAFFTSVWVLDRLYAELYDAVCNGMGDVKGMLKS